MKNIYLPIKFLTRLLPFAIFLMLNACGGVVSHNLDEVESTFSGSIGDGPIVDATVLIYDKNHDLIKTINSAPDATYFTRIWVSKKAFPITIEVEDGFDLVTGMAPDFKLVSVVFSRTTKHNNVNPFSTMIVAAARAASGVLSEESVSKARVAVMSQMNFGLNPNLVPDPISTNIGRGQVAAMTKSSEVMGEMIRRVRDQMNNSGASIDGNDIIAALADDISDGIIDGIGGNLTDPRISAVSKLVSAQVLIEALSNNLKVQGEVATSRLDDAIIATHPSVKNHQLTGKVTINREMLEQTLEALNAAQVLDPSIELSNLYDIVNSIPADSSPFDIEPVLPGYRSDDLEPVITYAVFASDEELEWVINGGQPEPPVNINSTPQLSGTAPSSVNEGELYSFKPTASDPDGDVLSFGISNRPAWASFNASTGRLTGTPGNGDVGTYSNINISVSDGLDSVSLGAFSITVNNVNAAPIISGSPVTSVVENSAYSFQPSASDPDGDILSFGISNRPAWASFNASTGRLTGTPGNGDGGAYSNINISVSDGLDSVSLGAFSITVTHVNAAPIISGSPVTNVVENSAYSFQPSASDPDGDVLTFNVNNLPAWASFDSNNGRLSGTPAEGDAGTYSNIVISVSDGSLTTSLSAFSIQVGVPQTGGAGSFSLSWTEPATRVDDTTLLSSEIASFRVYYGTSPGYYPNSIDVDYPAQEITISNLPAGTYYAVITTTDVDGRESTYSQEITVDVL